MYSGMHDQGPLPDLKEGGPLTLLTGCVKIAKNYNDEFLTQCIKEENENSKNHDQPNKRSKQQQQAKKISKKGDMLPGKGRLWNRKIYSKLKIKEKSNFITLNIHYPFALNQQQN